MTWRFGPEGLIDDPREALLRIAAAIHEAEPDQVPRLAVGPLESLFFHHEVELWDDIERLARSDPAFRNALTHVWAFDSEGFEARQALPWELGEWHQVQIRFVASRRYLAPDSPIDFRTLEVDGLPEDRLPPLLRLIADLIDRNHHQPQPTDPGDDA